MPIKSETPDHDLTPAEMLAEIRQLQEKLVEADLRASEIERVSEELRTSNVRFRKIFDHSNDGIFLVDPEGDEIIDVNTRASRMLGYTREELLSLPMSMVHPHDMARMRAFSRSVYEEGKGWTDELSCMTKAGRVLAVEMSASLVELDGRIHMMALVHDVSDRDRLTRELQYLKGEIRTELGFGPIIGRSEALRQMLEQTEKVAPTHATVLITGESGSGKELVARAIHELSNRSSKPLVRVNCASIPSELFESEFFGHVRGSFTGAHTDRVGRFEVADEGTLFLDEVGEIPIRLQAKLLRVLQEGQLERIGESHSRTVDVRVIAASNRDLRAAVADRTFRSDLYHRLSVVPIHVPPLRERSADVVLLAEHFLKQCCDRLKVSPLRLRSSDVELLESYSWPGNVRELENVIERGVILGRDGRLTLDIGESGQNTTVVTGSRDPAGVDPDAPTLEDVARLERAVIVRALESAGGRIYGPAGAAAKLGLKPTTLASRMKRMGIKRRTDTGDKDVALSGRSTPTV